MHFIIECPLENEDENLELFKIIFEQEKVKIPRDSEGWTPLHMTVDNGQSKICVRLPCPIYFHSGAIISQVICVLLWTSALF